MPVSSFLPVDPRQWHIEVEAANPDDAFALLKAAGLVEVDVLVDGRYAFSCEALSDGSWLVFERPTFCSPARAH